VTSRPLATSERPLAELVRAGRRISRLSTFGRRSEGALSHLKQAIKLSPLSAVVRSLLRKQDDVVKGA
jgi:hypothetical protein